MTVSFLVLGFSTKPPAINATNHTQNHLY